MLPLRQEKLVEGRTAGLLVEGCDGDDPNVRRVDSLVKLDRPPEPTPRALRSLERLVLSAPSEIVERALSAAREILAMDVAYVTELKGTDQVVRQVSGSGVEIAEGEPFPLSESYCRQMLTGALPNAVPDTHSDERVSRLPATKRAGIGSYIGVPLHLSDGRVYGTLCAAGAGANEALDDRDVGFMRVLADLIVEHLEHAAWTEKPGAYEPDEEIEMRIDLWLANSAHAIQAARSALDTLAGHIEPPTLADARLLVSELVTNCVLHADMGPEGSVGLSALLCHDRLQVAVSDAGGGFDPERLTGPDLDRERPGGWGLVLVEQLSRRWGVGPAPDISSAPHLLERAPNCVWFELDR